MKTFLKGTYVTGALFNGINVFHSGRSRSKVKLKKCGKILAPLHTITLTWRSLVYMFCTFACFVAWYLNLCTATRNNVNIHPTLPNLLRSIRRDFHVMISWQIYLLLDGRYCWSDETTCSKWNMKIRLSLLRDY